MTPGLAGFIAEGCEPQAWDDLVAAALAALAAEFGVVPERAAGDHGGTRRTTWLDTFDWRLHKAGLTLEYAPGRGGSELHLSANGSAGGEGAGEELTQPVAGWQAARPHLLPDLPDGPVTARIAGIVAMRALLPVVATSTVTAVYRLLNSDGKTIARLHVARPSLDGPRQGGPTAARQQTPLPPRLTITAIRGYLGQTRRAVRLVGAVPGLRSTVDQPLAEALRAIGRRPGDYSNKVDADITAAMPASAAGADRKSVV